MRLTAEQKLEIINLYTTTSDNCADLASKFECTKSSIRRMLINNNIEIKSQSLSRQKYTINENYFDIIDTEDKAYFLGLLYSDGYNYEKENTVSINLQENDVDILYRFKSFIGSDRPLFFKESKIATRKNQYLFSISNKNISQQLVKLGCFQNKSLCLKFPTEEQVPMRLIRHFIRGCVDGDGHIQYMTKKTLRIRTSITSCSYFLKSLQQVIKDTINVDFSICYPKRYDGKTTAILSSKNNIDSYILLNWIYKDSIVYLDRKYQKYQEIANSEISLNVPN